MEQHSQLSPLGLKLRSGLEDPSISLGPGDEHSPFSPKGKVFTRTRVRHFIYNSDVALATVLTWASRPRSGPLVGCSKLVPGLRKKVSSLLTSNELWVYSPEYFMGTLEDWLSSELPDPPAKSQLRSMATRLDSPHSVVQNAKHTCMKNLQTSDMYCKATHLSKASQYRTYQSSHRVCIEWETDGLKLQAGKEENNKHLFVPCQSSKEV